jgi:hypothetical protein
MAGDPNYNSIDVLLLCNGSNGGTTFTDSGPNGRTITVNGNTNTSTTQIKFGTASAYLDGTGDYLSYTPTSFNRRTDSYTFDMWVYPTNVTNTTFFSNSTASIFCDISAGTFRFGGGGTTSISTASHGIVTNQWQHLELVSYGAGYYFFLDGALIVSSTTLMTSASVTEIFVGYRTSTGVYYAGYMDDYRHTAGISRHTTAFIHAGYEAPDHQTFFSGDIIETLGTTDWTITATQCSTSATVGSGNSSGTTYSIEVSTDSPCNLQLAQKIDYAWVTGRTAALNEYCVPSNPEVTPHLFKCTTGGAVGGSEPTWDSTPTNTTSDGSAVWTCIGPLVNPISLGSKIPS